MKKAWKLVKICITTAIVYTAAVLTLCAFDKTVPDSLNEGFFKLFCTELLAVALIKVFKIKKGGATSNDDETKDNI